MTVKDTSVITPQKLRSGEPATLAALCDRRGAAVIAYCRRATGDDAIAVTVAAEAFAQFRRAIQSENALAGKGEAERILRSATRRCALVHAHEAAIAREPGAGTNGCVVQGAALLVFVEGALGPDEHAVVTTHVRECDSCAAVLQRLQDAEPAFKVKPGTPLPVAAAREILTALVGAAPVSAHGADETAVRDEALRWFVGDDPLPVQDTTPAPAPDAVDPPAEPAPAPDAVDPPAEPAPAPDAVDPPAEPAPAPDALDPPAEPVPAPDTLDPPAEPAPAPDAVDPPPQPAPTAATETPEPGTIARLRDRLRWAGQDRFGPSRPAMLLRGALRLAGVVVAAGVVGVLLGVGLSALTGADETPSPAGGVLPASTPSTSTPAAAPSGADKRPIEILEATARPAANGSGKLVRLSLRVRATNATGRVLRSAEPALFVDGVRVAPAASLDGSVGNLLAPSLDPGASAEGTLRFALAPMTADELAAARVRLRILAKVVAIEPVVAGPAAG